jgi:hypothetical protein
MITTFTLCTALCAGEMLVEQRLSFMERGFLVVRIDRTILLW